MCFASGAVEATWRKVRDAHGTPKPGEMHQTDGMAIWASQHDLTPDDHFDRAGGD